MSFPVFDPDDQRELGERLSPKTITGSHDEVLFRDEDTGFSLVRVWFAPYYVLPRHTHSVDCLYYVVRGSLTMGNQVLEFRNRTSFDMQIPGGQVERLRRMSAVAEEHGEQWETLKEQRCTTGSRTR